MREAKRTVTIRSTGGEASNAETTVDLQVDTDRGKCAATRKTATAGTQRRGTYGAQHQETKATETAEKLWTVPLQGQL